MTISSRDGVYHRHNTRAANIVVGSIAVSSGLQQPGDGGYRRVERVGDGWRAVRQHGYVRAGGITTTVLKIVMLHVT